MKLPRRRDAIEVTACGEMEMELSHLCHNLKPRHQCGKPPKG
jgi:hypothetical protein